MAAAQPRPTLTCDGAHYGSALLPTKRDYVIERLITVSVKYKRLLSVSQSYYFPLSSSALKSMDWTHSYWSGGNRGGGREPETGGESAGARLSVESRKWILKKWMSVHRFVHFPCFVQRDDLEALKHVGGGGVKFYHRRKKEQLFPPLLATELILKHKH